MKGTHIKTKQTQTQTHTHRMDGRYKSDTKEKIICAEVKQS